MAADSHLRAGAVDLWRRRDAVDVVHRVGADGQDVPFGGSWGHGWSVAAESGMKKGPEVPAAVSRLRPKRPAGDGFQKDVERPYFDSVLSFQAPVP